MLELHPQQLLRLDLAYSATRSDRVVTRPLPLPPPPPSVDSAPNQKVGVVTARPRVASYLVYYL